MRLHRWPDVRVCAVLGAAVGFVMSATTGTPHPFMAVLDVSVLGALIGYGAGDRAVTASLTLRLLMAGVWLSVGLTDPNPLGLAAVVIGGAFALLAIAAALRAARLERARARLTKIRNRLRRDI